MKIRWSLRLHVLVVVLITGMVTIFAFSWLSLSYFFSGMDVTMERLMMSEARYSTASDGHPETKVLRGPLEEVKDNMVIASRWEDLPIVLRERFNPSELKENQVYKEMIGGSLLTMTPPQQGFFVMKSTLDGELRYVGIYFSSGDEQIKIGKFPHIVIVFVFAFLAILILSVVLGLLMRQVSTPVERLKNWAKNIDETDLKRTTPDFHYRELDTLAGIIKSSLISVRKSAEREKRFLGFASHELRTPIAVTRTNSELLRKLIEKEKSKEKQLEVLERIERAGVTMTDLTETLLWLNRQEDKELPVTTISLGALTMQISEELSFLVEKKAVQVSYFTDETTILVPETLSRIIVTNLLRNAFQHTNEGHVEIRQLGDQLIIINSDVSENKAAEDLGFGLGLELTEKLISKYGWRYTSIEKPCGREVSISFHK
ncbi:sensor histidine kinase [Vibrio sp. HN007]|uniref:sensor histidine kinase n=1 Tax=Vibrio iocasae TaxID=3098914 RepID=UPI0035D4E003